MTQNFISIPLTHNYVSSITGLEPNAVYRIVFNDFMLAFMTIPQGELFFNKNRDPFPRNCAIYETVRLFSGNSSKPVPSSATINFLDRNLNFRDPNDCGQFTFDLAYGETHVIPFVNGVLDGDEPVTIKNPYHTLRYAYH